LFGGRSLRRSCRSLLRLIGLDSEMDGSSSCFVSRLRGNKDFLCSSRCADPLIYMSSVGITANLAMGGLDGGVISTSDQHLEGSRISASTRTIYG
jgi:hypothetical protein